jgi:hypothetical protein
MDSREKARHRAGLFLVVRPQPIVCEMKLTPKATSTMSATACAA